VTPLRPHGNLSTATPALEIPKPGRAAPKRVTMPTPLYFTTARAQRILPPSMDTSSPQSNRRADLSLSSTVPRLGSGHHLVVLGFAETGLGNPRCRPFCKLLRSRPTPDAQQQAFRPAHWVYAWRLCLQHRRQDQGPITSSSTSAQPCRTLLS